MARCLSESCISGAADVVVLDEVGRGAYGEFPELDISPLTGFPILSYFNQTNSSSGKFLTLPCKYLTLPCK